MVNIYNRRLAEAVKAGPLITPPLNQIAM